MALYEFECPECRERTEVTCDIHVSRPLAEKGWVFLEIDCPACDIPMKTQLQYLRTTSQVR